MVSTVIVKAMALSILEVALVLHSNTTSPCADFVFETCPMLKIPPAW